MDVLLHAIIVNRGTCKERTSSIPPSKHDARAARVRTVDLI